MKPSFKYFFYFSKGETKGIYILLGLIFIFIVANESLYYFNKEKKISSEDKELRKLLNQLEANLEEEEDSLILPINYTNFNPNSLSIEEWMQLGLSKKQAETIKNYQAKGGSFKIKSDLAKIYTITDEQYQKLAPFILLPESLVYPKPERFANDKKTIPSKKRWEKIIVDINTADSSELRKVYGIGPFFSSKIVSYRNDLGGYYAKKQLLEIWGISDSVYQALDSSLTISVITLKKINVNTAEAKELQKHPYINWNIANSIVRIREQHGNYNALEEILQSEIITDSIYQKISPYLTLN